MEPIRADVSREEQAVSMVGEAIRIFGHLDYYVNNAAWAWHQPITKIDSESWYNTLNTNLTGADIAVDGGLHLQPVNVITNEAIRAFDEVG